MAKKQNARIQNIGKRPINEKKYDPTCPALELAGKRNKQI